MQHPISAHCLSCYALAELHTSIPPLSDLKIMWQVINPPGDDYWKSRRRCVLDDLEEEELSGEVSSDDEDVRSGDEAPREAGPLEQATIESKACSQ